MKIKYRKRRRSKPTNQLKTWLDDMRAYTRTVREAATDLYNISYNYMPTRGYDKAKCMFARNMIESAATFIDEHADIVHK